MVDTSVMSSADSRPASSPAVTGMEVASPRSAGQTFAVTWSSAVVTSYTVTDTTSVVSSQSAHSRVTLAELQPSRPEPVTADMSHDLNTCFASPSATSILTPDGSYRTTYGPMQISAQVLSLPRSITNCRNLSRPLTLSYAGRQVIVPPSCIVLGAEGAKLLLPPQTIVPNKPVSDALDLSRNSTHSISSTANLFHDNTAELTLTSPSKSGSVSETVPSDKSDSLLPLSSHSKVDPAVESCTVTTVPTADEAQCSAESADQQVSLDEAQKCVSDQSSEVDISKLNDQCLVHIFTFLHLTDLLRSRCVCSHWNTAARDPLLVNHSYNFSAFYSLVRLSC